MRSIPLSNTIGRLAAAVAILLSLLVGGGTAAAGEDELTVVPFANAPGWITVTYSHSDPPEGIVEYRIKREGGGGITLYSPDGAWTDADLKPDTEYRYQVCAIPEDQDPTCSDWVSERTLPLPGRPANFDPPTITDVDIAPSAITIRWGPVGEYSRLLIRWGDVLWDGRNDQQPEVRSVANGSYTVSNLQPGHTYRFGLKGCSTTLLGSSCGDWSKPVQVTIPPPVLTPPPNKPTLTVTSQTATAVTFEFSVQTGTVTPSQRFLLFANDQLIKEVLPHEFRAVMGGYTASATDPRPPNYGYHVCFKQDQHQVCSDVKLLGAPTIDTTATVGTNDRCRRWPGLCP
jgi:hypothetical protein